MNYVFGPVPSRRLGRSLGIDPIPLKTCNWNCVYCQLGRTSPLTKERREYTPSQEIIDEVQHALDAHLPGQIDWLTFVGSGEPTLHSGLGWLIRQVKARTDIPVAVITNGSLLNNQEVREEISLADAVLPSLDAGSTWLYLRINRPSPRFGFDQLLEGLGRFRQVYSGQLWVEVMLIKGLNDSEKTLLEIAHVLEEIHPDQVHINLPTRPPAEAWVKPPDIEGLKRAAAILGNMAKVLLPSGGDFDLSGYTDVTEAILSIITRHPMREEELRRALVKYKPGKMEAALASLINSGHAQIVERNGTRFWSTAGAQYRDTDQ
jgi:wyosine [tRNA(Phe)-imidazoG37] synthetase (radical SAM superfamily)